MQSPVVVEELCFEVKKECFGEGKKGSCARGSDGGGSDSGGKANKNVKHTVRILLRSDNGQPQDPKTSKGTEEAQAMRGAQTIQSRRPDN